MSSAEVEVVVDEVSVDLHDESEEYAEDGGEGIEVEVEVACGECQGYDDGGDGSCECFWSCC